MKIRFKQIIIIVLFFEYQFVINIFLYDYKNKNPFNFQNKNKKTSNYMNTDQELKGMQQYINMIFNGTLIDKDKIYYPSNNPKISVIIAVYNGEGFLRTTILSIQNQDFKDIEIVMVDDGSLDNSVKLIKELMLKEPRIVLYINEKNRGIIYSKTKAINKARGKYILILDEDDIYAQRDAFSTLYKEAEKYNLDLLHFRMKITKPKMKTFKYRRTVEQSPIIFQPEITERMFKHTSNGEIRFMGGLLTTHFIKRNILF